MYITENADYKIVCKNTIITMFKMYRNSQEIKIKIKQITMIIFGSSTKNKILPDKCNIFI